MQQKKHTFIYIRNFWYLSLLVGILVAFMPGLAQAYAAATPGGDITDPVVRNVDLAQPAVVRILTGIKAQLKVNISSTTAVTFPQQSGASYTLTLSGTGTFISSHGDILTA